MSCTRWMAACSAASVDHALGLYALGLPIHWRDCCQQAASRTFSHHSLRTVECWRVLKSAGESRCPLLFSVPPLPVSDALQRIGTYLPRRHPFGGRSFRPMAVPPRATYTFTCQHETKCAGDTTCHESSARLLRRRKASARLQSQWHMFSQCATSPGSLSSPRLVRLVRLVLTNRVSCSCWCQPTAKPSPSTSCQLIDRLPRSPAQIPIRLHQTSRVPQYPPRHCALPAPVAPCVAFVGCPCECD